MHIREDVLELLIFFEKLFYKHEAFFSYLLGSVISVFFTLLGVWLARFLQNRAEDKVRQLKVKSFFHAIKSELNTINTYHLENFGVQLGKINDNAIFPIQQLITESYFHIYDSHGLILSDVTNNALKEKTIETYFLAKSFCDTIRTNNKLLEEYGDLSFIVPTPDKFIALEKMLVSYAVDMKESHIELQEKINETLRLIEESI